MRLRWRAGLAASPLERNRRGGLLAKRNPVRIGKGKGKNHSFPSLHPTLSAWCVRLLSTQTRRSIPLPPAMSFVFFLSFSADDMAVEVECGMVCLYRRAVNTIVSRCGLMPANSRAALSACVIGNSNPLPPPAHAWTKKQRFP